MHHIDIHHIAVIGAGTMGAGIAQLPAQHSYQTLLYDVNSDVLATAREHPSTPRSSCNSTVFGAILVS
ncbi:MAG: hypothetical protein KDD73_10845 [Anaerolineales bacterium]|nr:hypothetical protein [Anaerolineales bacterium]MCB9128133.1 hypothetical protein [Ardenticatenales bacterium]MCB9171843.1 hypothetical protein [Ardenticatenales bacterium]